MKRTPFWRSQAMVGRELSMRMRGQRLVGLAVRDLHQRLVEVLAVVAGEDDLARLGIRHVDQHVLAHVVEAAVHEAEAAGGEIAVAALLGLRRLLQHEHARARLAGRDRRAQGRVAGANHDHVVPGIGHLASARMTGHAMRDRVARSTSRKARQL